MAAAGHRPPVLLKFGGELLEDPGRLDVVVRAVARTVSESPPLVIVHGGGKEIDAALAKAGVEKRQVDGLRITDAATLDVVASVLLDAVNPRFVAALVKAGVPAVGLSGVDGGFGVVDVAPPHRLVDGRTVDLGLVGVPSDRADWGFVRKVVGRDFVPVIASVGLTTGGIMLNVNADTMAGWMAASLGARRLVVAGTTPGVLDERQHTVQELDTPALERMIAGGTATAGMIAKLRACEHALSGGVADVVIVDGTNRDALEAAALGMVPVGATRIVASARLAAGSSA